MGLKSSGTHDRHCVIRGEIVLVVIKDYKIARGKQAVSRIAGHHVNLMIEQSAVQQPKIHDAWWRCEMHIVCFCQARKAVGSFHEFITKSGAPVRSLGIKLRKRL